jgi:hypothetical protein
LSEGDLESLLVKLDKEVSWVKLTREPITAPMLKITQNQEMYRPLLCSGGYDIMIEP